MKKVLYRIFIVLILILITLIVFSAFNLSFFGFRVFRVASGSMEPMLSKNDYIVIKEQKEYEVGDVVTYSVTKKEFVTHRIIEKNKHVIITKGDANNTADKEITDTKILGKLLFKIKGSGFLSYLFSKTFSWILLFIVGITITIIIPDKKKKKKKA